MAMPTQAPRAWSTPAFGGQRPVNGPGMRLLARAVREGGGGEVCERARRGRRRAANGCEEENGGLRTGVKMGGVPAIRTLLCRPYGA